VKKLILISILLLSAFATIATACPLGQHPYGGVGPHHDGGYCSF